MSVERVTVQKREVLKAGKVSFQSCYEIYVLRTKVINTTIVSGAEVKF